MKVNSSEFFNIELTKQRKKNVVSFWIESVEQVIVLCMVKISLFSFGYCCWGRTLALIPACLYSSIKLISDFFFSDADSDSSEEGMESFLEHHRRAVSVQRERESVARESVARDVLQRDVRASIARESVARQLETIPDDSELKL